jgi:hypothetical protein
MRLTARVADGTRTRDHRDHNPGLYQLSYRHHGAHILAAAGYETEQGWRSQRAREDSNPRPTA